MAVSLGLYAEGSLADVQGVVHELSRALGDRGAVWVRHDFPPTGKAPADPVQLHFDIEVFEAKRRVDANPHVIEAIRRVDPDFEVIQGGDVFSRTIRT